MRGVVIIFLMVFHISSHAEYVTPRGEALPVEFSYQGVDQFEPTNSSEELDELDDPCIVQARHALRLYLNFGPYERLREQIRQNYGRNVGLVVSYQYNDNGQAEIVFSGTRTLVEDHAPQLVIESRHSRSRRCPLIRPSDIRKYLEDLKSWSAQRGQAEDCQ